VIKVDYLVKNDTTTIHFESRTTDEESLSELDHLYEILMSNMQKTALGGGYDSSARFSIILPNVVQEG
jgi:hypothetical protein